MKKLRRGVPHLLGGFPFRLFPLALPEVVKRRVVTVRPGVAGNQMELRHRNIEFRAVRVINLKELGGSVLGIQRNQPLIAPDAMLHVDHGVPDPEFREIPDHGVDVCLPFAPPDVAARVRLIELGLCHHRDLRLIHHEAVIKRPVGDRERGVGVNKRAEPRGPVRGEPILAEEFENRLFAAGG